MSDFDIKIWLKKLAYGLGFTVTVGAIAYVVEEINATDFPPEYALVAGITYSVLVQIQNYIKHKYLVE